MLSLKDATVYVGRTFNEISVDLGFFRVVGQEGTFENLVLSAIAALAF